MSNHTRRHIYSRSAMASVLALMIFGACGTPAGENGDDPKKPPPKLLLRERTVYVPYEKLRETFEKEGRGVFLPYEEFVKLWNAAQPKKPPKEDPKPPADAVITGGSYTGIAKEKVARFEVTYQVKALAEKWSRLALPLQNVAIESVKISDPKAVFAPKRSPARKGHSGTTTYELIMPKPGDYALTLAFSVRVNEMPGQRSISFGIPSTAVSRLDLTVPEKDLKVDVTPKMAATTTTPKEDQTQILAFVGNANHVAITWKRPIGKVEKGKALAIATQMIQAELGERILRVNTAIGYKIERNEAEMFRIRLPENMRLLSVKGPNIRTWAAKEGVLEVNLHSSVKDTYALRLRFERVLQKTPEKLAVPFPKVEDVLREDGYVTLTHEAGLRVRVENSTGLSQVDPRELPQGLRQKTLLAGFRYLAHPLALNLTIESIRPELRATVNSVVTLGLDEDVLNGWADLRIAKVGLFKVRLKFEKRWEVLSMGDPKTVEDFQVEEQGADKIVTVNLKSKAFGSFRLPFKLSAAGRAAPGELVVSPPAVLDALQDKGIFGITAPKAFKVTTVERKKAVPANVQLLYAGGLLSKLSSEYGIPLAYAYSKHPVSVKVSLERRKTEIRVAGSHVFTVAEAGLDADHRLEYFIEFAGVDTLRLSAPSALDDKLHITCQNLKEKKKVDSKEGRSTWELTLQEKTMGSISVRIRHKQNIEGLEPEKPQDLELPRIRAEGVKSQQGYIAVRKEGSLEIKPEQNGLEQLEAVNLPAHMKHSNIYLAFRYVQPQYSLKLTLTRHVSVKLVNTVVDLIRETFVLSEEKTLLVRAELYVENAQGEQYLELKLPEKSTIRSVAVNGVPVPPLQRKGGGTLIKLATGGPFPIEMIYVTKMGANADDKLGWMGSMDLATLEVVGTPPPPVNKVELELFVPEDLAYMGFSGTLHQRRTYDPVSNTLAWVRDSLRGRSARPVIHSGDTSGFQAPRRVVGKFTTQGRLFRFQTLAPVGTVSFSYCNRKLFWLFDVIVFFAAIFLGWFLVKKHGVSRLWVCLGFIVVPICIGWFVTSDGGEPFVSWLAAGIVLAITSIVAHLRQMRQNWREARLAVAPDPYLEEAPDAPAQAEPPAEDRFDAPAKPEPEAETPAGEKPEEVKPPEEDVAGDEAKPTAQEGTEDPAEKSDETPADEEKKE